MTRNRRSSPTIVSLLILAVTVQGCSETVPRSVSYTLADRKDRLESPEGERVLGYERPDGSRVDLFGRAYAAGDSIRFAYQRFERKASIGGTVWTRAVDADTMVARADIENLLVLRGSAKRTAGFSLGVTVGLALVAVILWASFSNSTWEWE
jgi:hypothetical protein